MENQADVQVRSILDMAERMLDISEKGFLTCDDDGCLMLNGMVRELAYRLKDAAERELSVHKTKGAGTVG